MHALLVTPLARKEVLGSDRVRVGGTKRDGASAVPVLLLLRSICAIHCSRTVCSEQGLTRCKEKSCMASLPLSVGRVLWRMGVYAELHSACGEGGRCASARVGARSRLFQLGINRS